MTAVVDPCPRTVSVGSPASSTDRISTSTDDVMSGERRRSWSSTQRGGRFIPAVIVWAQRPRSVSQSGMKKRGARDLDQTVAIGDQVIADWNSDAGPAPG